ncbi:MAG: SAF domain-containing protein [Propionibacteriaceae bacterium]|nr:SAF domain-containing protein [Propionibacteriaceae bacterium]
MIALGVLLVMVGGIGAAALFTSNADQQPVVVMAADVLRGQTLTRESLAVVEVPGSLNVEKLGAEGLDSLVGQVARTDLPEGAFPLARHVGTDPLPAGQSLVGLRLPLGKLPTTDLPPDTTVRLVGLTDEGATTVDAVVASRPVLLDDGVSYSLDVQVADADADLAARLSAGDQVALIAVTREG